MSQVRRPPRIDGNASHYGCLPRTIAQDARQHDLAPDECLIMAVLISAAMVASREEKFSRSMAAGREEIKSVLLLDEKFVRKWNVKRRAKKAGTYIRAPVRAYIDKRGKYRRTFKRGKINKRAAKAGKQGFADRMKHERARTLNSPVTFRITRRALLCRAHLATSGQQFARLERILDRLSSDIKLAGGDIWGPSLIKIEDRGPDELVLTVFGYWLAQPYVRVPLPWPMKSAPAVFLWLVLQCLPTGSEERGHSRIDDIGERINIFAPLKEVRRSLNRAIEVINAQIMNISIETIAACEKLKVKTPSAFKLDFIGKNAVRFTEWIRRFRVADELEDAPAKRIKIEPVQLKPVIKRIRPTEAVDEEGEAGYQEMRKQMIRADKVRELERRRRSLHAAMEAEYE